MTIQFSDLGLAPGMLATLKSRGYVEPTPIQAQSIPLVCEGRDLLGLAQTGTGKTAAFVLPLLQRLSDRPLVGPGGRPSALILAPTRELAVQIGECVAEYGAGMQRKHVLIFGGVGANPQMQALRKGVDIIVATPGRLLDLIGSGHVKLEQVDYLVLDEADRLLDMGFLPHVRKILARLPAKRQSLLFSATMPKELDRLVRDILRDPVRIDIAPEAPTVDRIEQRVIFVDAGEKLRVLTDQLRSPEVRSAIVFTRTKHRASRVAEKLEKSGIGAEAIHGNKSQNARQRALSRFRDGKAWVLVATDIAARGIDVDGVTHVFNFELPNEPESYVHRIGRTARAGASGVAVSLCDNAERNYLRGIERLAKRTLTVVRENGEPGVAPAVREPAARSSSSQSARSSSQSSSQRGARSQQTTARPPRPRRRRGAGGGARSQ